MTTPAAAPAAPAAPSTPNAPKNGATEGGQPPATDPKVNAKPNNEPGAKAGETAAQTRQRMKLKLRKLDGQGEEELDLDENDIGRYVQKARVADKNRAADEKARQEWQSERDGAIAEPLRFFKERGVDLLEVARAEQQRLDELAKLDPVQRELAEAKDRLAKYESEKTANAEKAKVEAAEAAHRQLVFGEQALYKQAIAASGRSAATPGERGYLMKLYADVRELAEYAGVPLTPEQLAAAGDKHELAHFERLTKRLVASPEWRAKNMKTLQALAEAMTAGMDDASLMDFFGVKSAERLARAQLTKFRKNPLPVVADPQSPPSERPPARQPSNEDGESLMGLLDRVTAR